MAAAIAALQLRSTDSRRAVLMLSSEPLTDELAEVMDQLHVTLRQTPFNIMKSMEWDFGVNCLEFWACHMKFLTWNQTDFAAILNLDTDFLVRKPMGDALFDIIADHAQSPFDVGGVADPIVAMSHKESAVFDVFNGGMFVALPSHDAFETLIAHAHASRWIWGEMHTLNSFARKWGHWIRLPITFNIFPNLLHDGTPTAPYGGVNMDSVYGLHFAGVSKTMPETTADDCRGRSPLKDCIACCLEWVAAADRLRALIDANRVAHTDAAAAERVRALLPPAYAKEGVDIVKRNRARGFVFDLDAFHDSYTPGPYSQRADIADRHPLTTAYKLPKPKDGTVVNV